MHNAVISDISNQTEDVVINSVNANKFYNTSLSSILSASGATQYVLIVGATANGAALYTAFQTASS